MYSDRVEITPALGEAPQSIQLETESSGKISKEKTDHYVVPLVELSVENITYAPVVRTSHRDSQRQNVLRNVSTTISPYKLSAWMGPSGSGKTSLLSVASNLVNSNDLIKDSTIRVNGEAISSASFPKRLVGVVWQDDWLLSNLTVEENVMFAARLKAARGTSDEAVQERVQSTLEELGLWHCRDNRIGNSTSRGVSGGERKRVSVAVELVARPSVLLLDEPTSGLDATTAFSLVSTLKDLCSNGGHSIAVVIHQPRTTIYNLFDNLLLLSKGHMVYNGPPDKARIYLEEATLNPLPPETGIADWIMDILIEDEAKGGSAVLSRVWEQNKNHFIIGSEASAASNPLYSLEKLQEAPRFETSFFTQFQLLAQRTMKQQRGERLTSTAATLQLAYLFFTVIFWWRIPDDTERIFERTSLVFFLIIAQAMGVVNSAVTVFQGERTLLHRERAKKLYGVASYFIAKTLSDMSTNVLLPVAYSMVVYWTVNLRPGIFYYLRFLLAYYLTLSTAQSMGLFVSILLPKGAMALLLAPPMTLFFMIMGGFYVPFKTMHKGIVWATWLSFARYGFSAIMINEFHDRDIPCSESDVLGNSSECPLPGEGVTNDLGIVGIAESYWFNVLMVLALQIAFRLAAYVLLRRMK